MRWLALLVLIGLLGGCSRAGEGRIERFGVTNGQAEIQTGGTEAEPVEALGEIQVVAENLEIPWEVVELPDSTLLVTERPGRLVRIYPDRREMIEVVGVRHQGEGGLMGMALHPRFEETGWLYLMMTTQLGAGLTNRVVRFEFDEAANRLADERIIIEGIPGASNHDGGRLAFGPDGYLYITTGDAQQEALAQTTDSLAGKILRVTDVGEVPTDNPFGNAVYSLGHRNVQGLAWDDQGRLWASEHGPSGASTGCDEINLIVAGGNYGWPKARCEQTQPGMRAPVRQSGRQETWAPSGLAILADQLLVAGLRGEAVYGGRIEGETLVDWSKRLTGYGRLRAVKPNDSRTGVYVLTSNRDGRGAAAFGDDRLLLVPENEVKE